MSMFRKPARFCVSAVFDGRRDASRPRATLARQYHHRFVRVKTLNGQWAIRLDKIYLLILAAEP